MAVILIAEDDKEMQQIIVDYLTRSGHECLVANDGIDAVSVLKINSVDIAIIDIMMPHLDGFTVCKIAREMYKFPIIILTAKGDEADKLKGYEYGCDDYMTKPFSPNVLVAKVNVLLKRASNSVLDNILKSDGICLNPSSHEIYADGKQIVLTHYEYELLCFFMQNKNQVFSREQILNRIWGYEFEGSSRTVDTHIKTLRQKLGIQGKHIVTLIRSGYKFEDNYE